MRPWGEVERRGGRTSPAQRTGLRLSATPINCHPRTSAVRPRHQDCGQARRDHDWAQPGERASEAGAAGLAARQLCLRGAVHSALGHPPAKWVQAGATWRAEDRNRAPAAGLLCSSASAREARRPEQPSRARWERAARPRSGEVAASRVFRGDSPTQCVPSPASGQTYARPATLRCPAAPDVLPTSRSPKVGRLWHGLQG